MEKNMETQKSVKYLKQTNTKKGGHLFVQGCSGWEDTRPLVRISTNCIGKFFSHYCGTIQNTCRNDD